LLEEKWDFGAGTDPEYPYSIAIIWLYNFSQEEPFIRTKSVPYKGTT